jgi:hypothetical protein
MRRLPVAILLALWVGAGFGQETSASTFIDTLGSASYQLSHLPDETVQLHNGAFQDEARNVFVALTDISATGDLDGDGLNDAVVVLVTNTGSALTIDLAVVLNREGIPVNTDTIAIGEDVFIDTLTLEAGRIELAFSSREGAREIRSYLLVDGALTEVGANE